MRVVDAFTSAPFAGNPAGVVFLPPGPWPGEPYLRNVAAEMKHAETAFLVPRGPGEFDIRWFTPTDEVDLCGHATLAAAHAIWEPDETAPAELAFHARRAGVLTCVREGARIRMNFPGLDVAPAANVPALLDALRLQGDEVLSFGRTRFDYFIEAREEGVVRSLAPDLASLARHDVRGVIVASAGHGEFDVVSRFFAPRVGVPEDPVTGSAHCAIATHFSRKLGKPELRCWQASPRGGEVRTEVVGDRVMLRGQAVTVVRGWVLADGRA